MGLVDRFRRTPYAQAAEKRFVRYKESQSEEKIHKAEVKDIEKEARREREIEIAKERARARAERGSIGSQVIRGIIRGTGQPRPVATPSTRLEGNMRGRRPKYIRRGPQPVPKGTFAPSAFSSQGRPFIMPQDQNQDASLSPHLESTFYDVSRGKARQTGIERAFFGSPGGNLHGFADRKKKKPLL